MKKKETRKLYAWVGYSMLSASLLMAGCGSQTKDPVETTQTETLESVVTEESYTMQETVKETESVDVTEETSDTSGYGTEATGEFVDGAEITSPLQMLEVIWENFPEENRFPCFGGNTEQPVQEGPGVLDLTDTDYMTYTLLIPAELHDSITEGASMVHAMNANTFTGACVKVEGKDQAEFIEVLKNTIVNNQFMCGFPDRLVIIANGDYIAYAYGKENNMSAFQTIATEKIGGVTVEVDQLLE